MIVVALLVAGLIAAVLGVRAVRWVALVQQKEYRPDRLLLFLKTAEGAAEWWRFPNLSDFSKTGLKRPKVTIRSAGTGLLTVMSLVGLAGMTSYLLYLWQAQPALSIVLLFICLYAVTPLVAILWAVVPGFIFRMYTQYLLLQAGMKLQKGKARVIGITGSYGKTATKILLAHVLSQKYSVFLPPRSHNTVFSISKSILNEYKNQEIAVIEYAAYKKGEIARLAAQIKPEVAVLTGLAEQHLGLFGSLQKIIEAKSELVAALPASGLVYCANAESYKIVEQRFNEKQIFKVYEESELKAKLSKLGTVIVMLDGEEVETKLVGLQYFDTIRTVWQIAQDWGVSKDKFKKALVTFEPTTGFTKMITGSGRLKGVQILDDGGTSNPAGFAAAITLAAEIPASQKILVTSGIVDLGERSESIHTELAQKAAKVFDQVWYVGEAGKQQFEKKFPQIRTSQSAVESAIEKIDLKTVLVIEGRMPTWFTKLV